MTRWASGIAALTGAVFLAIKALGILATGEQVPFLFEAAPACLGLAVLTLPGSVDLHGGRRTATIVAGGVAVAAGVVALAADVAGEVWGPGLGVAMLAVTTGALVAGWSPDDWTDRALLVAGVAPFPSLALGGVLEPFDERLLEVGLLPISAAWAWVGLRLLRGRTG